MTFKKKVFISQPMNGLSEEEILKARQDVIEALYDYGYEPGEIEIIDSYIKEYDSSKNSLYYLGKSLQLMSEADIVVFAKGWETARGCKIEYKCAKEYGFSYLCAAEES